jgi:hypothetical protein
VKSRGAKTVRQGEPATVDSDAEAVERGEFGLTGMFKSDTRYHNIDFCSLDVEETTGARWAKSKPQSYWGVKRSEISRTAGVIMLF